MQTPPTRAQQQAFGSEMPTPKKYAEAELKTPPGWWRPAAPSGLPLTSPYGQNGGSVPSRGDFE